MNESQEHVEVLMEPQQLELTCTLVSPSTPTLTDEELARMIASKAFSVERSFPTCFELVPDAIPTGSQQVGKMGFSRWQGPRQTQELLQVLCEYIRQQSMIAPNGAVVFDIDATLLGPGDLPAQGYRPRALEFGRRLYECAIEANLKVYLVTARLDYPFGDPALYDNRKYTIAHLIAAGYTRWDALVLNTHRLVNARGFSLFKYLARHKLCKRDGAQMILAVGDRWADLLLDSHYCRLGARVERWLDKEYDERSYYLGAAQDPLLGGPYLVAKLPEAGRPTRALESAAI